MPGNVSLADRQSVATNEVCFFVEAEAQAGLLCRLIGFFAQLDLPAPAMRVDVSGEWMAIEARLADFGENLVPVVAHKMAGLAGVRAVDIHPVSA
jgi:hypothetical protein